MITDYSNARDEIFAQLTAVLPALNTLLGYTPNIVYQGVETAVKMPTDKLWVRISQQTVIETQATLRADNGRRYRSEGLVFVQIFIPKTEPQNYAFGLSCANVIKNAYRGKQTNGCIWFRNVRIQELPAEMAWFRVNVVAEYQYDEIG